MPFLLLIKASLAWRGAPPLKNAFLEPVLPLLRPVLMPSLLVIKELLAWRGAPTFRQRCKKLISFYPLKLLSPKPSTQSSTWILNPRLAWGGGGGRFWPPSRISPISQQGRQRSTRNFQYLTHHQFDVFHHRSRKIREDFFFRRCCFSDVLS